MTPRLLPRHRLHNQYLSGEKLETPAEVVGWLGAVQAQDYLGSLWAVGLRMNGGTEAAVERALADKLIVRSYPMRGTLHYVLPADLRWMLKLLTPRILARSATQYKQSGLDQAIFKRAGRIIEKALEGGNQFTRPELYEHLNRAKISTEEQRGLHILGYLSQQGLLCYGTRKGKQHTFTLLDEWIPSVKPLSREESLGELVTRYITSHGPATAQDFAWWSGLAPDDARNSIEMVKSRFCRQLIDGKTYWMKESADPKKTSSVLLLPAYDEYTVAYKDRTAILDEAYAAKAGHGIFNPVLIVDGQIAGTWQRTIKKESVEVSVTSFATKPPSRIITSLEDSYSRFIGMPVNVNVVR